MQTSKYIIVFSSNSKCMGYAGYFSLKRLSVGLLGGEENKNVNGTEMIY